MIAKVDIVVDLKKDKMMYYFRVKLGRIEVRSQLHYQTVKQCKSALKKLAEDLQITYEEEA